MQRRRGGGKEMPRSKIVLDAEESCELQRRIKATAVAVRDRQRAEIVVLGAAGFRKARSRRGSASRGLR
jgi:Asp/Glu/hydantoin racemase